MGNLLRVLNDKGTVPKVEFFVDFESKYMRERERGGGESTNITMKHCNASYKFYNIHTPSLPSAEAAATTASHYHNNNNVIF